MKFLYTHRTQGVGAEGAHIKGMYEAFRDLGLGARMICLPGCNPSETGAAPRRAGSDGGADKAGANTGAPAPKRLYRIIADQAPQILFEAIELAYNGPLFLRLAWACLRSRPAFIYERYSLNTFAPSWVCRLLGIKHVLEVNDSVVIERSRPLELKAVSSLIEGFCLRSADLSITITERFRRQLGERFGSGLPIEVMTNAVARGRFDRAFDRGEIRARLGLGDATVLGATGQFLEWHGLEELVEQMGPGAEAGNLAFLFVGDGPARARVMAKAEALGITHRVRFTGMLPIDEVPGHLSVFDIAVIPMAAAHASPMKLIEYMAMGLPIVAPDLPSIQAALMNGSMGRLFPAGDMRLMKERILEMAGNRDAARALGRGAREHVFATLTWDRHAQRVLEILGLRT